MLRTRQIAVSRQQAALLLKRPLPTYRRAAVVLLTGEGKVIGWNAAAERFYGSTAAEAIGRSILNFRPAPNSAAKSAEILAYLQAGNAWADNIRLRTRSGLPLDAFIMNFPIGDIAHGRGLIFSVSVAARQRRLIEPHRARIGAELQLRVLGAGSPRIPIADPGHSSRRSTASPKPRAGPLAKYAPIGPIRKIADMHEGLPRPADAWRLMQRIETYRHRAEAVAGHGRFIGSGRTHLARMWRRLAAELHTRHLARR